VPQPRDQDLHAIDAGLELRKLLFESPNARDKHALDNIGDEFA